MEEEGEDVSGWVAKRTRCSGRLSLKPVQSAERGQRFSCSGMRERQCLAKRTEETGTDGGQMRQDWARRCGFASSSEGEGEGEGEVRRCA
jgi:hypothetical protein